MRKARNGEQGIESKKWKGRENMEWKAMEWNGNLRQGIEGIEWNGR